MQTPQQENSNQEICTIRIVFPVQSDEQAIDMKKKVQAVFPDNSQVHIHFEIMPAALLRPRTQG